MSSLAGRARERIVHKQQEPKRQELERRARDLAAAEQEIERLLAGGLEQKVLALAEKGKSHLCLVSLIKPHYRAPSTWLHRRQTKKKPTLRVHVYDPYKKLVDFIREQGLKPVTFIEGDLQRTGGYSLGLEIPADADTELGNGYTLPLIGRAGYNGITTRVKLDFEPW